MVILAGGLATRLGSLTADVPKCLIEINGRPFVDWQLDLLVESGYADIIFCISHKSDMVQEHLTDGSRWGIKIRYSSDGQTQLGTGGAIYKALPMLGKSFGVIYGDSYLPINYIAIDQEFSNSNHKAMMTVYRNEGRFDCSNVEFKDGKLLNYEKNTKDKKMRHIDYGLTYFQQEAFFSLNNGSESDLSNIFHQLVKLRKLEGFEVFNRFYEIGSVEGIKEFSEYLRKIS